jgi:hypothetical protein
MFTHFITEIILWLVYDSNAGSDSKIGNLVQAGILSLISKLISTLNSFISIENKAIGKTCEMLI